MPKRPSTGEAPFDVKEGWAWRLRWLRNLLLSALVLIAFIDCLGVPHFAWDYRCYGEPVQLSRAYQATYYGPLGRRVLRAGEHGEGVTLVKWLPLETPLHRRLLAAAQRFVDRLAAKQDAWDDPL